MTFADRAKALVSQMTLEEKVAQMCYDAPAIDRLGIPAYNWWNECLHGVARAGKATVFPQAIAMAASFDEELLYRCASAISDEARAKYNQWKKAGGTRIYQGLTYWSPNINIFRDPRWGRGHETYGEDPCLTARMGTAFIRGLQGEGKYRKVDATVKHYAVHSGPEALRHGFDARVSEKDLYETYLYAFKYCIDHAKPAAVMGAYNRTNGEACCASHTLLQKILREQFGFEGYVVSDCGAIRDINEHHKLTDSPAESAALAVNNGCDLNCGNAYLSLVDAVEMDLIDEETVTKAVERLFTARFALGMFDKDCEYDRIPYEVVESRAHRDLSRKMAEESIVLLKNNGILPLKEGTKIALIGPDADSVSVLLGNYNGMPTRHYTVLEGLETYGDVLYARGCKLFDKKKGQYHRTLEQEAVIAAEHADAVILCLGLDPSLEGEEGDGYNSDASGDKTTLELPFTQQHLYEAIKATGKPIIYVNVSGSAVNLSDQKKHCDALLQLFYPGAEGGLALADILYGKVSPSGRLPVTFYRSLEDLPPFEDYAMEGRTYKFFRGEPVYPFGFGLTYSEVTENWRDANTVEVENRGNTDTGYVVLQYEYIPHKSLRSFCRIFLRAGEKRTVTF